MKKTVRFLVFSSFVSLLVLTNPIQAQELDATVSVVHQRIRGEDAHVFDKMQDIVRQFLNSRKWTNQNYEARERIKCRFLIDLQKKVGNQEYSALLTVQSSRPVYNSDYNSTVLNYKDQNVVFKFDPYQPLIFNENRISGSDPSAANLSAVLAYYVYLIIGLDQDTFSPNGGNAAFQMLQKIVNEAPSGRGISGWQSFDGTFNRYWIMENLLNVRYQSFHDILYNYYRRGLDQMYEHPDMGRREIAEDLNKLNALDVNNPNLILLKLFFTAKGSELASIFSEGPSGERVTALNLLQKLDPPNKDNYSKSMKP